MEDYQDSLGHGESGKGHPTGILTQEEENRLNIQVERAVLEQVEEHTSEPTKKSVNLNLPEKREKSEELKQAMTIIEKVSQMNP